MEKITVFIHIPKTCGKSMVKMLEQKYKTLQIYETIGGYVYATDENILMEKIIKLIDVQSLEDCFKYAIENGYNAIIGNIEVAKIIDVASKYSIEIDLMCVLRNPLDRVYSEYCHNLSYGVIDSDYTEHCRNTQNTQYRLTSGNLGIFKHVIDFDLFPYYMSSIGFNVIHENRSGDKKRFPRSDDIALLYNNLDIELYKQFKSQ